MSNIIANVVLFGIGLLATLAFYIAVALPVAAIKLLVYLLT